MSTIALVTAQELARLPRGRVRYELIRGELRTMSPAGAKHGVYAMIIGGHLWEYVDRQQLGHVFAAETGFLLEADPDTVLAADVSFIGFERMPTVPDEPAFLNLAPDLAIEVLSPSDRPGRSLEKCQQWLDAGTRAVVIVDPPRQMIFVHRPRVLPVELFGEDELEVPDIVPGWKFPLTKLFGQTQAESNA